MMVELKIFRTTPPSKSLSDAIIGMNFLMVMILFEMKRRYLAPKVPQIFFGGTLHLRCLTPS
jgi:hypothetical protein